MKRGLAVLLVLAVFGAGVVVGALGMQLRWLRHPPRHGDRGFGFGPGPDRPGGGVGRGRGSEVFAERMASRLELSPEQSERIGAIVRDTHERARALREEVHPRVQALLEDSARRISAELTPAQRERFEELRREHGRRADFFLLGRGPLPRWLGPRRPGPGSAWLPPPPGPDAPGPDEPAPNQPGPP